MRRFNKLVLAGAMAFAGLGSSAASAAVIAGPEAGVQSCSAFSFSVTIINCAGGYAKNLQSSSLSGSGALAGLLALGGGNGTFLEPKLDTGLSDQNGGIINFTTLLTGYTVFGIHAGNAGVSKNTGLDGNATFLFAFDAGSGVDMITVLDRLSSNSTGLSNVALYRTGSAVPEPATWAMMLVGFGAAGYSLRRRRKVTLQAA